VSGLANLPQVVLGPLAGHSDADWFKAPPGKWCAAQIVQHVALGIDYCGRTFDKRRAHTPMRRRRRAPGQLVAYLAVLRIGWVPLRWRAPVATTPAEHPSRADVTRQFLEGVERLITLEHDLLPARAADLFVKHPALGDLTLSEWLRFHDWHCAHHARQIRARLAG
jgi:hypothetical protein